MVGRIVFICIMKGLNSSNGMIIAVMNIGNSFVKKRAQVSKLEIRDFMSIGQSKSLTCIENTYCYCAQMTYSCGFVNLNAITQKYLLHVSSRIIQYHHLFNKSHIIYILVLDFTDHDIWPPFWPRLFLHKIIACS